MAGPIYRVLAADTDTTVDVGFNAGQVEVTLVANAATTYFNATGVAIGSIATPPDGNHVLNTTLVSKVIKDETTGNTVVHLRSTGTPTVCVLGL